LVILQATVGRKHPCVNDLSIEVASKHVLLGRHDIEYYCFVGSYPTEAVVLVT
jgi:hypothetical protein